MENKSNKAQKDTKQTADRANRPADKPAADKAQSAAEASQSASGVSMLSSIKGLLPYYKPYLKIFFADMFFAILSASIALAIPLVVRYVTSTLIYLEKDEIIHQIIIIGLILIGMLAVDWFSRFFMTYWGHIVGLNMESDMRADIFGHLQKLSFSFYDDTQVGQLMSRATTDLFDISEMLHHGPENIILSFLKIFGAMVILLGINGWLTLAAFIVLPFMFWVAYTIDKRRHVAYKKNREKIGIINGQIEDSLSGIRVVKSFANEDIENAKFAEGNEGFRQAKKNSYFYMGLFHSSMKTFTTLIEVCVIVTGCILIALEGMEVMDLVTFLLYIAVFVDPIRVLVDFTDMFQTGITGFERFQEIMQIQPDIADEPGAVELKDVKGRIRFEDVSFHYTEVAELSERSGGRHGGGAGGGMSGAVIRPTHGDHYHHNVNQEVLHHINLDIPAGSYTAFCGSSGVGKTTLCSLIPRFYEVSAGRITLDGRDIKDFTLKSLRDHIGVVQQDVYLFAGTIAENIEYGRPGASREQIIEAAKAANAHEFIMAMPDGYDTYIGQRGIKLSGGQKQRLSIARVFLKNPPILIFDEATSALDNESEKVVQESMERLAKDRTTLVIAHRLTTIQNAQRILVLTEKGIEESGTHQELLAKGGIYAGLYNMHK